MANPDVADSPTADLIRLIMKLRRQGISDAGILSAMERTPRHLFVAEAFAHEAYADLPVPLMAGEGGADGECLPQPSIQAFMLQLLEVGPQHTVLEVGTGSGFQTAMLCLLARRVYTVERDKARLEAATQRLEALGRRNLVTLWADGMVGFPGQTGFDRIILNGALLEPPAPLLDQLKDQGKLVMPRYVCASGEPDGQTLSLGFDQAAAPVAEQHLTLTEREGDSLEETICLPVRFTSLRHGLAKRGR